MDSSKRNAQKGKDGLVRIRNAFLYSKDGILAAWREASQKCPLKKYFIMFGNACKN